MIDGIQLYLVIATALACGLMSGALYAFSAFVMAGLGRLPSEQGIQAMQSINVTAVRPGFMTGFFGTTLACVAVAISAIVNWDQNVSIWLLLGAGLYLVGMFVVTVAYHVPQNNKLAATSPTGKDAEEVWSHYLTEWTKWNHLRWISSLAAAAVLTIALRLG